MVSVARFNCVAFAVVFACTKVEVSRNGPMITLTDLCLFRNLFGGLHIFPQGSNFLHVCNTYPYIRYCGLYITAVAQNYLLQSLGAISGSNHCGLLSGSSLIFIFQQLNPELTTGC
jgi:hypothetical protein